MKRIQDTASVIAFLDMLASLAYVAEHNQYVRPTINHNGSITIKEGRHPVIEQMKGILKEHGAVNALMSGSGPTVFGIFTDDQNAKEAYEAMQEAGLARQLFLTGFADGRGREE